MVERASVASGDVKRIVTEVLLEANQREMYERVLVGIERKSGFAPKKWQIHTKIFMAGLEILQKEYRR